LIGLRSRDWLFDQLMGTDHVLQDLYDLAGARRRFDHGACHRGWSGIGRAKTAGADQGQVLRHRAQGRQRLCRRSGTADYQGNAWKYVTKGTCDSIQTPLGNGSLQPIKRS